MAWRLLMHLSTSTPITYILSVGPQFWPLVHSPSILIPRPATSWNSSTTLCLSTTPSWPVWVVGTTQVNSSYVHSTHINCLVPSVSGSQPVVLPQLPDDLLQSALLKYSLWPQTDSLEILHPKYMFSIQSGSARLMGYKVTFLWLLFHTRKCWVLMVSLLGVKRM